jgi:ABC-type nitrate/sulfonate/bicarbonate transport system ATPase subunit
MSLEEVTKRHGNDVALAVDGVGMQVAPGGVAVIGRPRSGKSVLLSLIASLDRVVKAIEMTPGQ